MEAVTRIKGMFVEMPGTEWTVADAERLSGVESSVCHAILDAMRQAGFLTQRANGVYLRCHVPARDPDVSAGARTRRT